MTDLPDPDGETTVGDLVDVLSLRIDVLGELRAGDGPLRKRALVERLDVSRSTVNRGIQRLERLGLVRETDEGYTITPSGELIAAEYLAFTGRLETVVDAQDLLNYLPSDAPLSLGFLADAETVRPTRNAPVRPAVRVSSLITGADRVRALAKSITRKRSNDVLGEEVERGLEMEVVSPLGLFEYVYETLEWVRDHLADGRYTAYINEVPYGLFLIDRPDGRRVAVLFVYDDEGQLRGVFLADTDRALAWAQGVCERYRDEARPPPVE